MSSFKGLAHIGIYTKDAEKSKKFYIDHLGFDLEYEAKLEKPGGQWVNLSFIRLGTLLIELLEPSDRTKAETGQGGSINHIAIEVKDIDSIVKALREKGITMETEEASTVAHLFNGVRMVFLEGPSGERIELLEHL